MKHLFNEQIKVSYDEILKTLQESGVKIHDKLKSRSTMNFGKVYQYKGVEYEETDYDDIPSTLYFIGDKARTFLNLHFGIGMNINNCLVNIYSNGKQKMGYHSDDIKQLADGTGVLIVSVGSARILSFRKKMMTWKLSEPKIIVQKAEELEIISKFSDNNYPTRYVAIDKITRHRNAYCKISNNEYQLIGSMEHQETPSYQGFHFDSIYTNPENTIADEFVLTNGSIFYMDAKCQEEYEHAILTSTDDTPRISLTFRQLK